MELQSAFPSQNIWCCFDHWMGLADEMWGERMGRLRRKVVGPLKKAWGNLRIRIRKRRPEFPPKLYNDVQACGYEDVRVMWSILHHSYYGNH
ncbi:hypothetical protein O6H91_13G079800 [Diphasiastrum complanatum]|uniref:Uncharacterized protein n=1 Tax=Diphasiastrum complanatum TaxID=34168 RepID=A0ACC2BWG2_DIPCM|nr:hypothetical protein O6H91_Y492100 [Diphasiastrum complanatum]KAJ7297111.1 hypothetical protein O6H91_Y079600 [Diphasiastrum complanatum]KAJ7534104.1 hypothetical protein O6H91_13G079800 [Diphasiastrum complanatum]